LTDQLNSKNLVPFKKRRAPYHIPGMTGEDEEHGLDQVDHDLSREEQRFIRHYLGYADALLKNAPTEVAESQEGSASLAESFAQNTDLAESATASQKDSSDKDSNDNGADKAA
jgi:hypothetical protein